MLRMLTTIVSITWALWFGGMISLMIFVTRLFEDSTRMGTDAAPILFRSFAMYQLVVGMVCCGGATLMTTVTHRRTHAILSLLLLAALACALMIYSQTTQLESLRVSGLTASPHFTTLHHHATYAYLAEAMLLLLCGLGWSFTPPLRKKVEETVAA